jgi:hypothetical protein
MARPFATSSTFSHCVVPKKECSLGYRLLTPLIWIVAFLGFSGAGVIGAFYPGVVQRALLSQPKPKFAPKAEDSIAGRWMGGRKYPESEGYVATLRIIGFCGLLIALLMLVTMLRALIR